MNEINQSADFVAGYVAIVGRPNVGKSTLLNTLLHEKISITSNKPQTTRWQILGINTYEDAQIIYVDTPGINNKEKHAMNRYLNQVASSIIPDADVIVFVVDAERFTDEDEWVLNKLKSCDKPVILAINKIDLLADKVELLPIMDTLKNKFNFTHIVPISAFETTNIESLEQEIVKLLPQSPMLFPPEQVTDKSDRFRVTEIIREKLIRLTEQEIPYATTVEIEQYKTSEKLIEISAIIWVEREGQRIIIIGKKGHMLKKIGMRARADIEKLLQCKVFLRLWVKVKERWTDDEKAMRSLGYE